MRTVNILSPTFRDRETTDRVAKALTEAGYSIHRDEDFGLGRPLDIVAEKFERGALRRYAIHVLGLELTHAEARQLYDSGILSALRAGKINEYWLIVKAAQPNAIEYLHTSDEPIYVYTLNQFEEVVQAGARNGAGAIAHSADGRVVANYEALVLNGGSVRILIEHRLAELRSLKPNEELALSKWQDEIDQLEKIDQNLEELLHDASAIVKEKSEKVTIEVSSKTFSETIRSWWSKDSERICATTINAAIFTGAVSICSLVGSGGPLTAAIAGVLVGGGPVVDALKALGNRSRRVGVNSESQKTAASQDIQHGA